MRGEYRYKPFAALLLLASFLLFLPRVSNGFEVDARAAVLGDMNSTTVLFIQNPDRKIAPASLTKILTMYILWEAVEQGRVSLDDTVVVSRSADDTGGASINLKCGERVTLRTLMKGMGVASGNDACVAAAELLSGSQDDFVKLMNRKARELGMEDSVFKNPHGLPAKGQVTTARDMFILGFKYIKRFPRALGEIHSKKRFTHNSHTGRNHNRLLGTCAGVDGLKTGYVRASKYNVISTAERDGNRLLAVVLGAPTVQVRARETRKLLDAGFQLAMEGDGGVFEPEEIMTAAVVEEMPEDAMEEFDRASVAATPAPPGPWTGLYAIQESSFQSRDNAKSRAENLLAEGLQARVVEADLGDRGVWHRVVIGDFQDLAEARNYRRRLVRDHGLSATFILKNSDYKGSRITHPVMP